MLAYLVCFGVRFSLYLASWWSDFDNFFLCVWFLAPLFFPQKMGGAKAPLPPPWIRAWDREGRGGVPPAQM